LLQLLLSVVALQYPPNTGFSMITISNPEQHVQAMLPVPARPGATIPSTRTTPLVSFYIPSSSYDASIKYADKDLVVPDTGVTREYWLELSDVTVAPDGVSRSAMAVNGTIPGPTLFADWGDTVVVHVNNNLETSQNGTSIHWHGIRQNGTNDQDGVSSITQCPTAPGQSTTYTWRATQYGSTWYHSHFALQAWQGILGGIIINGPATANYDEDLGMLFLNDWDHQVSLELSGQLMNSSG
jgi:hypothetical protein